MTLQEEAEYINEVLPIMARQPAGYDISEYGGKQVARPVVHVNEFVSIAARLVAEGFAVQNDPRFTFYLALTPLGKQVAETGYLHHLTKQQKRVSAEDFRAKLNVWSTAVSAAAALITIGITLWLNNSLDKTNAQLEAQDKRLKALEAILQHSQDHQAKNAQPKSHQGAH